MLGRKSKEEIQRHKVFPGVRHLQVQVQVHHSRLHVQYHPGLHVQYHPGLHVQYHPGLHVQCHPGLHVQYYPEGLEECHLECLERAAVYP